MQPAPHWSPRQDVRDAIAEQLADKSLARALFISSAAGFVGHPPSAYVGQTAGEVWLSPFQGTVPITTPWKVLPVWLGILTLAG